MTDEQKAEIRQMRINGAGYKSISSALGIPLGTVKTFCRRDGTEKRGQNENVNEPEGGTCLVCGALLEQKEHRKAKRFCSDKCRMSWWNSHKDQVKKNAVYEKVCAYCDKPFSVYGRKEQKYCCMECYRNGRRKHNGN